MCDSCREQWGDEIYKGVEAFCEAWPDAEFGPGHIVLSDFNCEEPCIRWCLGLIAGELSRRGLPSVATHRDEERGINDLRNGALGQDPAFYASHDTEELQATATFLREWLLPRVQQLEGESSA